MAVVGALGGCRCRELLVYVEGQYRDAVASETQAARASSRVDLTVGGTPEQASD